MHDLGDAMNTKHFFHQIYRKFTTFVVVDASANDVSGVNIRHHIEIKICTIDRSGEFGVGLGGVVLSLARSTSGFGTTLKRNIKMSPRPSVARVFGSVRDQ